MSGDYLIIADARHMSPSQFMRAVFGPRSAEAERFRKQNEELARQRREWLAAEAAGQGYLFREAE